MFVADESRDKMQSLVQALTIDFLLFISSLGEYEIKKTETGGRREWTWQDENARASLRFDRSQTIGLRKRESPGNS